MENANKNEKGLFAAARELSDPVQRGDFLDKACAGDPEMRQRLQEMLEVKTEAEAFFQPGTIELLPTQLTTAITEKPGDLIGRYKLREKIGEGGCGVVYVAEQEQPVRRRVALKVIKMGMDTKSVVARFEAERQALALMDHPNIARVLDAGATETGRPFFVMELVRGVKITDYCDQNKLVAWQRLELFVKVCQAVQHAHQKGIIHRDLKPSNILVTLHDGVPVPKVIDFGIAKATEGRLTENTVYTELHQFIGTPAYMSPEQAETSGLDIDTRSDIYSLGVLLYELLTGHTPFDLKELIQRGLDEIRRTIREVEPPRPSTRLSTLQQGDLDTVARARGTESVRLQSLLRGDLDWIIMKSLEKDRTRRYETANGLASDINRYLNSEPVLARPASAAYRFAKVVRRNRIAFCAAGGVVLALTLGMVVSAWEAANARRAARLAEQRRLESEKARDEAESVSSFLIGLFRSPDPARDGRSITMVETLGRAVKWLDGTLTNQPELQARMQATLGLTYFSLGLKLEAVPLIEKSRGYLGNLSNSKDTERYNLMCEALGALESCYLDMGRRDEATSLAEQLLELSRKANGPQHPKTSDAMQNLAAIYAAIGRQQEATKLAEDALELSRKTNGLEHTNTLWAMLTLADLYQGAADRQTNVLQLREEALRLGRKVEASGGGVSVAAMQSLAGSYDRAGRTEDALRLRQDALQLCQRVKGPEHPDTIGAMWGLADSLTATGRKTEALKLRGDVLTLRKKVSGPEHPDTIFAMYSLANAYSDAGRLNDALKLREETLSLSWKVNGPEDQTTLVAMLGLAGSYGGLPSHRNDALKLREELVRLRTKLTGPEAPNTISAMFSLADSYENTGRHSEALKLREQLLELCRRVNGPEHFTTIWAMANLAESYTGAGHIDQAIKLYQEALRLDAKTRSPESSAWVGAMAGLAVAHAKADRPREAAKLLEEASMSKHLQAFDATKIALLQAWYGMEEQYRATRQRMLKSSSDTDDVTEASYTTKLACARPVLELSLQEPALTLARRAVALLQNDSWVYLHQLGLGMAEYRSGHFPAAEQALIAAENGAAEHAEGPCPSSVQRAARLYRAMTLIRLEKSSEAAKLYEETSTSMQVQPADERNPLADGASYEDVIAWLALNETKALLSPEAAAVSNGPR